MNGWGGGRFLFLPYDYQRYRLVPPHPLRQPLPHLLVPDLPPGVLPVDQHRLLQRGADRHQQRQAAAVVGALGAACKGGGIVRDDIIAFLGLDFWFNEGFISSLDVHSQTTGADKGLSSILGS